MRPRTVREMRELDRRTIEEYGIPGLVLMENAGLRAADVVAAFLEETASDRVVILSGKGNNGGDGFVVARHLWNRGVEVEVFRVGGDPPPGSDAATNLRIAEAMGIPVAPPVDPFPVERVRDRLGSGVVVVDALLGTGLSGDVREPYRSAIRLLGEGRSPVVAIDGPSGLDGDTGEVRGVAVRADRTVTFGAPKAGFDRGDGPAHVGRLTVAPIGIPRQLLEGEG